MCVVVTDTSVPLILTLKTSPVVAVPAKVIVPADLSGWELAYIQTARQPLNALSYMSRQNNAEPVHYKGNLAALCEL